MHPSKNKEFKKLIKMFVDHRNASGITQREVAINLKITSAQYVSNFERCLLLPSADQFKKLVRAYGVKKDLVFEQYKCSIVEDAEIKFYGSRRVKLKKVA